MQIWRSLDDVPADLGRTVVVDRQLRRRPPRAPPRASPGPARSPTSAALPVVAVTFDPHPMAVLRPEHAPTTLTTIERRAELLARGRRRRRAGAAVRPRGRRAGRRRSSSSGCWSTRCTPRPSWSAPTSGSATGPPATWRRCARPAREHDFAAEGIAARRRPAGLVVDLRPHLPGRRRRRRRRRGARPPVRRARRRRRGRPARPRARLPDRQRARPTATTAAPADGVYAGWLRRLDTGETLPGRDQRRHQPDLRRRARAPGRELRARPRPTSSSTASRSRSSFVERLRGMVALRLGRGAGRARWTTTSTAPASCWRPDVAAAPADAAASGSAETGSSQHGLPYFVPTSVRADVRRRLRPRRSCLVLVVAVLVGRPPARRRAGLGDSDSFGFAAGAWLSRSACWRRAGTP